jgi:hypothetical protein
MRLSSLKREYAAQRLIDFRFAPSITSEHSFRDFPSLRVSHKKVFRRDNVSDIQ